MKEKIEYYTITPNLKQLYGKKVFKDTEFTEQTEDGRVKQEFKDLTLTTTIETKQEQGQYSIEEYSKVSVKVPEGTVLIWSELEGFIIPQASVCTLEELKKTIGEIEEIYSGEEIKDDTKGNEGKDI